MQVAFEGRIQLGQVPADGRTPHPASFDCCERGQELVRGRTTVRRGDLAMSSHELVLGIRGGAVHFGPAALSGEHGRRGVCFARDRLLREVRKSSFGAVDGEDDGGAGGGVGGRPSARVGIAERFSRVNDLVGSFRIGECGGGEELGVAKKRGQLNRKGRVVDERRKRRWRGRRRQR